MAILAYVDHRVNQFEMSRSKRNCAWGLAIAAIVIGCLGLLILIIALAVGIGAAARVPPRLALCGIAPHPHLTSDLCDLREALHPSYG